VYHLIFFFRLGSLVSLSLELIRPC